MGIPMYRNQVIYGDVLATQMVKGPQERGHVLRGILHVEMGIHASGMHARIGTPGAHNGCRAAQHGGEGILYDLLHPHGIRLALPSAVRGPVVGQMQEITHYSRYV